MFVGRSNKPNNFGEFPGPFVQNYFQIRPVFFDKKNFKAISINM